MNWTHETPTKTGWYWYRNILPWPLIVRIFEPYSGEFRVNIEGEVRPLDSEISEGSQWAGPIPEPEEGVV